MKPIRPTFANPPLIERAISVVFKPLDGFAIGDFGLFWSRIIDDFPDSETLHPVGTEIETFDRFRPLRPELRLASADELPRAAFRNTLTGELVQLQSDRFGFNWIKTNEDHKYPHSEATLTRFYSLFSVFMNFVRERGLGDVQVIQCEITNVNVVLISDIGESFADVATVLKVAPLEQDFNCVRLEQQLVGSKHLMIDESGRPIGRIHSLGQPSLKVPSDEEAFRFDITARGLPIGEGVDATRRFFEVAVSAVNAVFLSSITAAGRKFWGEHHA